MTEIGTQEINETSNAAPQDRIGVLGWIGIGATALALLFTVIEPWIAVRSGTSTVSSIASFLMGSNYQLESAYPVWSFFDLGNSLKLYLQQLGETSLGNTVLGLLACAAIAWFVALIAFVIGLVRCIAKKPKSILSILVAAIALFISVGCTAMLINNGLTIIFSFSENITQTARFALLAVVVLVVQCGIDFYNRQKQKTAANISPEN